MMREWKTRAKLKEATLDLLTQKDLDKLMIQKNSDRHFVNHGYLIGNVKKNSPYKTIHAYKYTRESGRPPINPTYVLSKSRGYEYNIDLCYRPGYMYEENSYETNPFIHCGPGINVATMAWIKRELGYNIRFQKLFKVEIDVKDIVSIPFGPMPHYSSIRGAGKFRVKKMRVLYECDSRGKEL